MSELRAIRVDDTENSDGSATAPGSFSFTMAPDGIAAFACAPGGVAGMTFRCPCGCGSESWLAFTDAGGGPQWTWDGNMDAPTLTPSIFNKGLPCQWHGFLTAGIWRSV